MLGLCLYAGHIPAHTRRLSSCLCAGHTLHTRGAWASVSVLGTSQRTRGTKAALGWGQVALESWLRIQGEWVGVRTHDQWV